MTPDAVLEELLERVAATWESRTLLTEEELATWPRDAVLALHRQKLPERAQPAKDAVCPGCEEECGMPVHTVVRGKNNDTEFFVFCEHRDDTNRIAIAPEKLKKWQCRKELIAGFIAESLSLKSSDRRIRGNGALVEIGILTGSRRARMLCLGHEPQLVLVVGTNSVPTAEMLHFEVGKYILDTDQLKDLFDAAKTGDLRYTPSTARLEIRKLDTAARNKEWCKTYRELKKKIPASPIPGSPTRLRKWTSLADAAPRPFVST